MLVLAAQLGSEAKSDPTLLHPLFARLPPLHPDTPDQPRPTSLASTVEEPNPYSPLILSELFTLADALMMRHPWDGPVIRGREIMGPASVVCTYDRETSEKWSLDDASDCLHGEVVRPGAADVDEEEVPERRVRRRRLPRGVLLALVVLGVGVAVARYGSQGGLRITWRDWWRSVSVAVLQDWRAVHGVWKRVLHLVKAYT